MRYYLKTTIVVSLLLIITSCSRQEPEFVIGVSQCSQDIWREKQNAELRMGAYINGNVELRFTSANDNDISMATWNCALRQLMITTSVKCSKSTVCSEQASTY